MIRTVWANGFIPPQVFEFTTHGYDKYTRIPKSQEHRKYRQEEAYTLFKKYPALTAAQVAELLGIENSAACHLLSKMDNLRWTREYVQGSTHKKRVYRSRV